MKLERAMFTFRDESGRENAVLFDDAGITVHVDGERIHRVAWGNGQSVAKPHNGYRPCVTHCLELLDQLRKKKPRGNFAKARQTEAKPVLKIHQ